MPDAKTVIDLLERGSDEAVAITGPGRKPLTYSGVRQQVVSTVSRLNELGVGRNDRVAIVLPNGPEMAVAFLAIAAGATTAPLNPGHREKELQFYMSDLEVRLLVIEEGSDTPARSVAEKLGIPVAPAAMERGRDEAVAITGPGRKPLTYSGVRQQVVSTVSRLNELGVGRNDRVAIVLPNGPEMAVAFLAIAAGATTAPLNPGLRNITFDELVQSYKTAVGGLIEGGVDLLLVGSCAEYSSAVCRASLAEARFISKARSSIW